jgi:hypothetical protein
MAEKDEKARTKPAADAKWHAVHVAPGKGACPAAIALGKRRFLSKEAPRLPLADCTSPDTCTCAYRHHKDRRSTPRRWSDQGGINRPATQGERRAQRDRRKVEEE